MSPSAVPGTENVAQDSPTDSARSPSARAGAANAHPITGNSFSGRGVQATKPLNCATSAAAVADKDNKNPATSDQPGFNPKPVQLGGESILDRLVPHMKKIAIALGVVAIVLTVFFTIRHFKESGR